MKTYKYLWEELISDENIREAVYNASHGAVRGKRQAMLREINYNIGRCSKDACLLRMDKAYKFI